MKIKCLFLVALVLGLTSIGFAQSKTKADYIGSWFSEHGDDLNISPTKMMRIHVRSNYTETYHDLTGAGKKKIYYLQIVKTSLKISFPKFLSFSINKNSGSMLFGAEEKQMEELTITHYKTLADMKAGKNPQGGELWNRVSKTNSDGSAQSKTKSSKQVTDQEKKDLFQLILKTDKEISEHISEPYWGADRAAKGMSVEKTDLNNDGQPEYIVAMEDVFTCGALANCPDFVYRKTGSEYQLLLRTFGQELSWEKTSTNKFRDLRSEGANTAADGGFVIYKFDGNKYQADKCFKRIYATEKGKKDKIIAINCSQYD